MSDTITSLGDTPKISGFEILEQVGEGGMGLVYKAIMQHVDGKKMVVAVKVLRSMFTSDKILNDMFIEEAKVQQQVEHTNIAKIYKVGTEADLQFIAMEFLPKDLHFRIKETDLPVTECIDILLTSAKALSWMHAKGIFHRDVKPQNILFRADGTAVLADFGVATSFDKDTENIAGSPLYMSPEQLRGDSLNSAADFYSLGATFFEMLSGEPAYKVPSDIVSQRESIAYLTKVKTDSAPQLKNHTEYQTLIDRLMHPDPAQRLRSHTSLREEIFKVRPTTLPRPPRPLWHKVATGAIAVVAISILAFWTTTDSTQSSVTAREYYFYEDALSDDSEATASRFLQAYPESPLASLVKIQVFNDRSELARVEQNVENDDPVALLTMAELRRSGSISSVQQSTVEAIALASRAAELGNPIAHYFIASTILDGESITSEQRTKAVNALEQAMNKSDFVVAETALAVYLHQNGTPTEQERAFSLLSHASEKGDRVAKYFLAELLLLRDSANSGITNRNQARELLKESEKLGFAMAESLLKQISRDAD